MLQNVIVAFPKEESNRKFKSILMRYGYHVPCVCTSGSHVLNRANELHYGVVLTGYRMTDMAWNEMRRDLPDGFAMVLMIPEARYDEVQSDSEGVSCLTVPFVIGDLLETLKRSFSGVEEIRRREKNRPRIRSPQEIADINKAKELLMEKRHMTEAASHRYLQRRSMESQVSLAECAQKVIQMLL